MKEVNILIVDDHPMIRDGIQTMLSLQIGIHKYFIDQAENVDDALKKKAKNNAYDIILMDYRMPVLTGAELTKRIRCLKPSLKILAISGFDEYLYVQSMMAAGANGYLLKNIGPVELNLAIETILKGEEYYSHEIIPKLQVAYLKEESSTVQKSRRRLTLGKRKSIATRGIYLTKREKQIMSLLARNKSYDQIAKELKISKRTVESNRYNMLNKLNAKNTISLVKQAVELGLI